MNTHFRTCLAELIGTFCLVFAGTGAIVASQATGAPNHVGVALTFGLVVLAMILAVGPISGAHLNPAVTVAFAASGQTPWTTVPPYILSQCLGAVLASLAVAWLFPPSDTLGATLPLVDLGRAFVLEALLTAILMLTILRVATCGKEAGTYAAFAVGSVVALEALFAGPITGASMNPARSLGPALVSGHLESLWLYLLAPTLGALAAVKLCCLMDPGNCCTAEPARA
jgi:aquaporin Z